MPQTFSDKLSALGFIRAKKGAGSTQLLPMLSTDDHGTFLTTDAVGTVITAAVDEDGEIWVRVGSTDLGAQGFRRVISHTECPSCSGKMSYENRNYMTGIAPRESLRCEGCKRLLMVFTVLGHPDLLIWQDEVPMSGFSAYVEERLEEHVQGRLRAQMH